MSLFARVFLGSMIGLAACRAQALLSAPDLVVGGRQAVAVTFVSSVAMEGWAMWSERVETWQARSDRANDLRRAAASAAETCRAKATEAGQDAMPWDSLVYELESAHLMASDPAQKAWPLARAAALIAALDAQGRQVEALRIERRLWIGLSLTGACRLDRSRYLFHFKMRGMKEEALIEEPIPWAVASEPGAAPAAVPARR